MAIKERIEGPMVFSRVPALVCDQATDAGRSKTQQHFKKEVDINDIVARFVKAGTFGVLDIQRREAIFADVSSIGDFGEVQRKVIAAQEAFMELPADLRGRFDNDPKLLVQFLANPANKAEAIKLGLLEAPAAPPQGQTEPVVPPPAAGAAGGSSAPSGAK